MSDTTHTPEAEIPDDRQLPDEVDALGDSLAALRDHLVANLDGVTATAFRGELTLEKVSRLTQMIRDKLPHQTASKAGLAATRLTGQPI